MLRSLRELLRPTESFDLASRGVFGVEGDVTEMSCELLLPGCSTVRSVLERTSSDSTVSADRSEVRVSSESWMALVIGSGGISLRL